MPVLVACTSSGRQSLHTTRSFWAWRRCGLLSSALHFSYSDSPRTRARRFCAVFLAKRA